MATALYGHLAGRDRRLADEVMRLRRRIDELQAELDRLRAERELMTAALAVHRLEAAPLDEPTSLDTAAVL